ncbi:hypothetical protein D3C76_1235960 [compost metagenome]
MTIPGLQHLGGALIELELLLDEEQPAIVFVTQLGQADPLGRIAGLGKDHPALGPVLIPLQQDASAAVAGLQHARQQQGGDVLERLDHFTGREAATLGGAGEERGTQATGYQWQSRGQGILTVGHAIKAGQEDQAFQ